MKTRYFIALAVFALLAVAFAYAQNPAMLVKVPFQFTVGDRVLPAGQYLVSQQGDPDTDILKIESSADHSTVFAQVLTRLAVQKAGESGLTFDIVSESYRLSEVWIPGADGYMINSTREKHSHRRVSPEG